MGSHPDVTGLLDDWRRGNHNALDQRLLLFYEELRRIARRPLLRERPMHAIQPTAAHVLKVSASTAKREWRTAKAWLTRELDAEPRR